MKESIKVIKSGDIFELLYLENEDIIYVINFCVYLSSVDFSKIKKCKGFSKEVYGEANLGCIGLILKSIKF